MSRELDLEDHIMHLNIQRQHLRHALMNAIHGNRYWKEEARLALKNTETKWSRKEPSK